MQDVAQQILAVFAEHNKSAGETLPKGIVLDRIRSLDLEMSEVRNTWHYLMGEGLIRQIGDEIELTSTGAAVIA